ncbi:extracellular elastinolytic metallo proteinase [Crassisporium funariophilum]|nr:extracellular elastinolytic metallo proteinase [Crassisporium funariophilum]
MRCFLTASLVVASLAGHVYGHRQATPSPYDEGRVSHRRKTLGFGPEHPHAVFRSSPYQIKTNGFTPTDPSMDPLEVARLFVEDVLLTQVSHDSSYKIRKDSYTDKNTGVTHVYVRQLVNGLEVSDGDMNINIKDGMVLSYGTSFFNGATPAPFSNVNAVRDPRQEACDQLYQSLMHFQRTSVVDSEQVIMGTAAPSADIAHDLEYTLKNNCEIFDLPSSFNSDDMSDFRPALLKFMATATPDPRVASDILNHFSKHTEAMDITPVHHFAPTNGEHPVEFTVDNVPEAVNPVKAKLAYIQVPNEAGDATELHLVWKFEVEMQDNWYETAISASAPHKIISVVDWASDAHAPIPKPKPEPQTQATYNVFAWGINDPAVGNRSLNKENFDALASPVGWHAVPFANDPSFKGVRLSTSEFYRNTSTTWGNNVFAQENWEGQNSYIDNYRPDVGKDKAFDFEYDPQETEKEGAMDEAQKYINTTIAQLFYTSNMVHDLYYRYGFDEVSGNFQQYNFGRGGKENDGVIANAQDGSGFNNANFMTPPDGQNGRMRMYLWNTAMPYRDGDLEAGIVIHELSHGLSTRLTGGPANSGCLGWGESGGMGEGWGDFLATTIRSNKVYSDYAMGAWAANRDNGIRNYVYSLDEEINPSTYKTLDKPGYWGVHAIGEVWAEILWVVSQKLIEKHGYSDDLFPPAPAEDGSVPRGDFYRNDGDYKKGPLVPKHGNSLIVQLVLNGMKLQVCRPSFFDARDAIIQADQVLTGGENFCDLWEGFSARGLGEDAKVINRTPWGGGLRTNGYAVPVACQKDTEPEPKKPKKPKHKDTI